MKRLLTICIAVVVLGVAAEAQDVLILKDFDVESAGLCEHVTGEISVTTSVADVVVTDEMPEGLALVDVTVSGGDYSNLYFNEDGFQVTLDEAEEYTITFEVQVTDVLSYESVFVENTATATDADENTYTESAHLELLPYEYFDKDYMGAWLDGIGGDEDVEQDEIPVKTKVYFLMFVGGSNYLSVGMLDAYVKDNLGGDLMLEYWDTLGVGSVDERLTGKTEKSHLLWEIGDIYGGGIFVSFLAVSTDTNTGTGNGNKPGHQEYSDDEPTVHELNSGATLKFTAGDTGFTCSVSSAPVEVQTIIPD